jgi:mannosyltransferase OCH1-like enzyme
MFILNTFSLRKKRQFHKPMNILHKNNIVEPPKQINVEPPKQINVEPPKQINIEPPKQINVEPPKQIFSIIPLNIFQTWHTLDLPPKMKENVELLQHENPEFKYHLYDDNMCREFIKNNFDEEVVYSFDKLKPGAYKADLWRYCVLYIHGGIYLDIKYKCVNNFKLIELTQKEHWVLDMDKIGVYNALIVCKSQNEILLKAIHKIVKNVKNKFYGYRDLHPTGPTLLSELFTQSEKNKFNMYHTSYKTINKLILYNGYIVLKNYNEYLKEQKTKEKLPHYSILWKKRNIYN